CIFFSRRSSLVVTLLVCSMYTICITAEYLRLIAPASIFSVALFDRAQVIAGEVLILNFLLSITILLVVWYLASSLSSLVRERDTELADTNRRLVAAQEERSRHMLTTTHQLKAPFAAISTNAQLILKGYSGDISKETRELVERISTRSRRLASEIQEMLQLANLSSTSYKKQDWEELDLAAVMRWCLGQVEPLALEKEIIFCVELGPAPYEGAEDHLKMIFSNLLVNAVTYSHKKGQVKVSCRNTNSSRTIITIADKGIGIPKEKLPLIFNEHYRTNEAVRHNKDSSGLGLSIVSRAAKLHGIDIRVESEVGSGTIFNLFFYKEMLR
ncbi:MAG: HAMP domain-containing histidine kinase, partial [Planctomycetes bacterium]|nr:HAMP domain-containing histidine kinase [Planctomycetota bacterium]